MRETRVYTVSTDAMDKVIEFLEDNGIQYDHYEYSAAYEIFEVLVNEYEEDAIDTFMDELNEG